MARHGEAEYETDLLADRGGSLTTTGRAQSVGLAEALVGERIAHIYVSSMSRAVQTGEIVAARLGIGVTVREGLREFSVGSYAGQPVEPDPFGSVLEDWLEGRLETPIPGGESGAQVVERMSDVLEEVADAHRGESVLMISHGGAICTVVPNLARNMERRFPLSRPLANSAVVELAADADGWIALSWAGENVPQRAAI